MAEYEQSEHTRIYLGEWHTHPEAHPTPSDKDISSVINISSLPDNYLPVVILCIVGLENNYWGVVINNKLQKIDVVVLNN